MSVVKRIIHTFYKNEYSKEIKSRFFLWLIKPHHAEEKEKLLQELWDNEESRADADTLAALNHTTRRLGWHAPQKKNWVLRLSQAAAILLLPLVTGIVVYHWQQRPVQILAQAQEPNFIECFVPNGEIKTVLLPDSSEVTINSGSILIYPEKFIGSKRDIYLNGEAYFDVARNPEKPFTVKANGMNIEVLGTRFNLSAYSDQFRTTVTLEEGSVEAHLAGRQFRLSPNEQLSLNRLNSEITHNNVDSEYIAAWKRGSLVFLSATMEEIIRTFEHRYNVTIYLNSGAYENEIITAKFIHGETLEESLQILKHLIPGFRYKIEESNAVKKVFIH